MKISVHIPTKNENKEINKVINNVEPIADEILLIDDSSDDTIKIAKQASKKVRVVKCNVNDFSKIRNKGINSTKNGWYILYIDSDELLTPELKKEIKSLKGEADVYLIKRRNFFYYGNCKASLTTRLIKGEPKLSLKGTIKFKHKFHELPEYQKKDLKFKELKGETHHHPTVKKYDKNNRYFKMHLERVIKEKSIKEMNKTYLKQLIKYILIFDYNPKYWVGNNKLWWLTLKYLIDFNKAYKEANTSKRSKTT